MSDLKLAETPVDTNAINRQYKSVNSRRYAAYFWNAHSTTLIFFILLIGFISFSTFFARKLKPAIIPDEPAHLAISKLFSTTWGIPADVPETYAFGSVVHKPFLYYWINGRVINLLNIFVPSPSDWKLLATLRLVSVFYSISTVILSYLLSKEIIKNPWWQLFVVFLFTNTLMFIFLSGGVNYDNLANLCDIAGIYFLVRVFNGKSFYENSLEWLICTLTGTLVKQTVLPLATIMVFAWILYVYKNRQQINFHFTFEWKKIGLLVIFTVLVLLNISIYGVNIVLYRAITPACTQVLTEAQCDLRPSVEQAQRLWLPEKLTLLDVIKGGYPDPIEYLLIFWIGNMIKMIFGIFGHKNYFHPNLIITFYRLFIIWVVFTMTRYWKKPSYLIGSLLVILIFYTSILLGTNYNSELITGFKHIGVQGRYIFPVIGIIYTLTAYFLSNIPHKILRWTSIVYVLILFLYSGPITFLIHYSTNFAGWFY